MLANQPTIVKRIDAITVIMKQRPLDLEHLRAQLQTLTPAELQANQLPLLVSACMAGQSDALELLEELGLKLNFKTETQESLLHLLSQWGHLEAVRWFAARFSAAHFTALLKATDANGRTPLHYACSSGNATLVTYLLEKGAPVNADNEHRYKPIHFAAKQGNVDVLKALVLYQADPSALTINGLSALHQALLCGQYPAYQWLKAQELHFLKDPGEKEPFLDIFKATTQEREKNADREEPSFILVEILLGNLLTYWEQKAKIGAESIVYILLQLAELSLLAQNYRNAALWTASAFNYAHAYLAGDKLYRWLALVNLQEQRIERVFLVERCPGQPIHACNSAEATRKKISSFREQLELKRQTLTPNAAATLAMVEETTQFWLELSQSLWKEVLEALGPAPCAYSFMGLGSMARREMSPYSDLEFALLLAQDTPVIQEYFSLATEFLELKVIVLGETKFKCLRKGLLSINPKGFGMDSGGNTPLGIAGETRLLGTLAQLLSFQNHQQACDQGTVIQSSVLRTTCHVIGERSLWQAYEQALSTRFAYSSLAMFTFRSWNGNIHKARMEQSLKDLSASLQEFRPKLSKEELDYEKNNFNVKAELYRLPTMALAELAHYYGISAKSSLDKIEALCQLRLLSPESGLHLKQAFARIMALRFKAQLFYQAEREVLYHNEEERPGGYLLSPEDIDLLLEIYKVLLPLAEQLQVFIERRGNTNTLAKASLYRKDFGLEAQAYERLGNYQEADRCYGKALAIDRTNQTYQQARVRATYGGLQQLKTALTNKERALGSELKTLVLKLIAQDAKSSDYLDYYSALPERFREAFQAQVVELLKFSVLPSLREWDPIDKHWQKQLIQNPLVAKKFQAALSAEAAGRYEQALKYYASSQALDTEQTYPFLSVYAIRALNLWHQAQRTTLAAQQLQLEENVYQWVAQLVKAGTSLAEFERYYRGSAVALRDAFRFGLLKAKETYPHIKGRLEEILKTLNRIPDELGIREDWKKAQETWRQHLESLCDDTAPSPFRLCTSSFPTGKALKPAVAKALIDDAQGCFKPEHIMDGQSHIIKLTIDGQGFYIKAYPEMPGMTYLIEQLHWRMVGHGTSFSTLGVLEGTTQGRIPVLISEEVLGENLHEVLKKPDPETNALLAKLDPQHFSELVLVALLINPEDGKPDNYVLVETKKHKGQTTYTLVSIDHDHALFPAFLRDEKSKKDILQVKTLLYCLPQMQAPIDPEARKNFLALNPGRLLKTLLQQAQQQNEAYQQLFSPEELKSLHQAAMAVDKPQASTIPIPLKSGDMVQIYQKMVRLQEVLKKRPQATLKQLLLAVEPGVGLRYQLKPERSLLQNFLRICEGYQVSAQGCRTTTKAIYTLKLKSSVLSQGAYETLENLSPEQALAELDILQYDYKQISSIRSKLEQGDFQAYKALSQGQELVLFGDEYQDPVDFQKIPPQYHESLLEPCLGKDKLCFLRLAQAKGLTKKTLLTLLEQNLNLVEVDLSGLPMLDENHLILLETAPSLRRLKLQDTAILELSGAFKHLNYLNVSHCKALKTIGIQATCLKELTAEGCIQLASIRTQSLKFESLKLKGCVVLSDLGLLGALQTALYLTFIDVQGCTQLQWPNIYQQIPGLPPETVSAIKETLHQWTLVTTLLDQVEKSLALALTQINQDQNKALRCTGVRSLKELGQWVSPEQRSMMLKILLDTAKDPYIGGIVLKALGAISQWMTSDQQKTILKALKEADQGNKDWDVQRALKKFEQGATQPSNLSLQKSTLEASLLKLCARELKDLPLSFHSFTPSFNKAKSPQLPSSLKPADPKALSAFLKLVTEGEQDKAEELLKKDPSLARAAGNVTDPAGKSFNNITGFQYAVWALDWHMWRMIRKYLPKHAAREQAASFETGAWVKTHGVHAGWQTLIDALQTYIDNYSKWSYEQCKEHWIKKVGGAQRRLPMHVLHEYCQPDRPFFPLPDFSKHEPPLVRKLSDGLKLIDFGDKYSILRSNWADGQRGGRCVRKKTMKGMGRGIMTWAP